MTAVPFAPDPDQARALAHLETGRSVALAGLPGSGKTRLIDHYLARTDTPALRLTLQPWGLQGPGELPLRETLGLPQGRVTPPGRFWISREIREQLPAFRVIVIDEVGSLRIDEAQVLRDLLWASARGFGDHAGYQVILAGDFAADRPQDSLQAQPHLDAHYGGRLHAFEGRFWAGLEVCRLRTPHRFAADPALAEAMAQVALGDGTAAAVLNARVGEPLEHAVRLVPTEAEEQRINAEAARALGPKGFRIEGQWLGAPDARGTPVPQEMRLPPGARVLLLGAQGGHGRGTTGTLTRALRLPEGAPAAEIETDAGARVRVERRFWPSGLLDLSPRRPERLRDGLLQLPLRPGWAVSLPASRGMTFERVHLDPRDFGGPGALHAALTRCGTRAGLTLAAPIVAAQLRLDERLRAFQAGHLGPALLPAA